MVMVFSQNTDVGNCCHWQDGDINLTRLGLLYCLEAQNSYEYGQESSNAKQIPLQTPADLKQSLGLHAS